VYVESNDNKVEDVIFTHTADIEDIEERLQNITKKLLF
jgi:tetrahydromethanopterin S-methyltransferase subunit G